MDLKGIIFDMDGVVTDTAQTHFNAWKIVFDQFLTQYSKATPNQIQRFTLDDYLHYVDGINRLDGVKNFLLARHIITQDGISPTLHQELIVKLAQQKNQVYLHLLKKGVSVFPSTIQLIRELKQQQIKVALISSSKNCETVLTQANLLHLFDVIVDGNTLSQLKLRGKPDPAIFLEAANRLGEKPEYLAVIEDAYSGITSAQAGQFGLIIGVNRQKKLSSGFKQVGADLVVGDLSELELCQIKKLITKSGWKHSYNYFDIKQESLREALCALGNGYFVTRGAHEESRADNIHYPGTYFAGVYNKLKSDIAGKEIINEDLVNMPNWLPITFRVDEPSEKWLDLLDCKILSYYQELQLEQGLLQRKIKIKDHQGRIFSLIFLRFVSMANPYIAAQKFLLQSENWSGNIIIKSGLDGTVLNSGIERYRRLNSKHLSLLKLQEEENSIGLHMRTTQSHIEIVEIAHHKLFKNNIVLNAKFTIEKKSESIYHHYFCPLEKKEILCLEKKVILLTSKHQPVSECYLDAKKLLNYIRHDSFAQLLKPHVNAWKNLWKCCDIEIESDQDDQKIIRRHIFHLLQTVSKNSIHLDAGIPARGLHGESYRGHIFWDELFILPFYLIYFPELARELLMYRYRRLNMARYLAREAGFKGAMYPWQSSSNGEEVTQEIHLNPRSNQWIPDYSRYQRHINAAIVYNIWHYYLITQDIHFLTEYGAEMVLEIARFFASLVCFDEIEKRYEIKGVVGPDEYHEKYPGQETPGINNNAYTNIMVVWSLERALDILAILSHQSRDELIEKLQLQDTEMNFWRSITKQMKIIFLESGIISQFENYDQLKEFSWQTYTKKYVNIERLDRILKAEGDSTDAYQVSKQADVIMLFYLFPLQKITQIFNRLNYSFDEQSMIANVDYYLQRTSHGSTLSKAVFAAVLHRIGHAAAMDYYKELLLSDTLDTQGGTTGEGIHLGAMAASITIILYYFVGIEIKHEALYLSPKLPTHIKRLKFHIKYFGQWIFVDLNHHEIKLNAIETGKDINVFVRNNKMLLKSGDILTVSY